MKEKDDFQQRKKRALKIVKKLKFLFPTAHIVLTYSNAWELLVAVRLSAQCTDKKVNEVTEKLFSKYTTVDDYARANLKEFEQDIRQTGFYRAKAKSILESAKIVKEKFDGKVPETMEDLLTLPGIGRKSAVVILGNAYNKKEEGIAVDTHVKRISKAFGLTHYTDPDKIEKELMKIIPKKDWFFFTYGIIDYGRKYYPAHKLKTKDHPLGEFVIY